MLAVNADGIVNLLYLNTDLIHSIMFRISARIEPGVRRVTVHPGPCRMAPDRAESPMTDTDNWLERYAENHSNVSNPLVYWAAVPMVVIGTVGLLWYLPIPEEFNQISPFLNWGSAFLIATAIYYFIISLSLAIGMLPFLLGIASLQLWLAGSRYPALGVATGLLVAGIVGLLLGRRKAGGIPAVLQDLQLMMIGPAWLLSLIYRRLGIPY